MKIIHIQNNQISITTPSKEALQSLTINEIAKKSVPLGVAYWIVDSSVIPADPTYRQAWELDLDAMGEPHGHGEYK